MMLLDFKNIWFTLLLFDFASCRPSPSPKAAWVRDKTRSRTGVGRTHGHAKVATPNPTSYDQQQCADLPANDIAAPYDNVFWGLLDDEAASVTAWLFSQEEFNLTKAEDAHDWDNTILNIQLLVPNKTDVLNYLDNGGAKPARYAQVRLDHRASESPYYAEIVVGPLPLQPNYTGYQNLSFPYTRGTDGRIRNIDADTRDSLFPYLYSVGDSIKDITMDLWNGTAIGAENETLDIFGIDPLWQEPDGTVFRWDQFWNLPTSDYDSETLLPLGLYFKTNMTGRDSSKWEVQGWLYNDVFYNTTEDFRNAYFSPGFEKLEANVDGPWSQTFQQGPVLPLDKMPPPVTIAPTNSRYSVDKDNKYIKWMDFEFYLGFNRDTAMSLWDIRYKGQRIIYELSLQEAVAHYAGNDPMQSGTTYLDSFYGFGPFAYEMVKGYDCPTYATYWNSSFYVGETTHTHIDSLCMFESVADYPMQRHSSASNVAVTKNVYFTVRSICTVGNYDYLFNYQFYMDGSIHVEVRASGYIQSAYWAANGDYGYKIHDALSGSMHDHVLNYKIDIDVLGVNNTMTTQTMTPSTEYYKWNNGKPRNTMKLVRGNITNEDQGKLNWGENGNTQFKVVNMDQPNKYGEFPGFRFLPSQGTIHLTVVNSSNLENAGNWATHDLFVTKQHDYEPKSTYPYNGQDVANPQIDFNKFFNSEDLTQTDIVVWANLGMHHVPHTGDLPNTVFTTAHSGLQIMPLNYLYNDPSRQTVNMVQVNYGFAPNASIVDTYGQDMTDCEMNYTATQPDLTKYVGDVVIRKFPYDPNDPYFETDGESTIV